MKTLAEVSRLVFFFKIQSEDNLANRGIPVLSPEKGSYGFLIWGPCQSA